MTDDPCDPIPTRVERWFYGRVMLDRETDPFARRVIKTTMNMEYGKLGKSDYPRALIMVHAGDPCDEWLPPLRSHAWHVMKERFAAGDVIQMVNRSVQLIEHHDNPISPKTWTLGDRERR